VVDALSRSERESPAAADDFFLRCAAAMRIDELRSGRCLCPYTTSPMAQADGFLGRAVFDAY